MPEAFTATRPLHGRVAWVTGASRGIGRATAHALAHAGASVVLGSRGGEALENEARMLTDAGCKATAIAVDVADWDSCAAFDSKARDTFGPPDILVNNAGIGTFRPIDKFTPYEFEYQFRVNVFGTFYMTRLAVPSMMMAGRGHIVNVSSLASESEAKMGAGYFATKWAMNGFTKCVMQDVRESGVNVTLVCPGSVDTRFHYDAHPNSHPKDQTWMVDAGEVASAILHALTAPDPALISRIDIRPARVPRQKG